MQHCLMLQHMSITLLASWSLIRALLLFCRNHGSSSQGRIKICKHITDHRFPRHRATSSEGLGPAYRRLMLMYFSSIFKRHHHPYEHPQSVQPPGPSHHLWQ
ncbi:hypothetical protein V2G26_007811 [Clonostachys chloroleuca]